MNEVAVGVVGDDVVEISDPSLLPSEPVVSVLMLAYNHEKFLRDAIEGVLLQQVDIPIELVIAEDCSTDATLRIALDYQKRFPSIIRVLTHTNNVGMHLNHRSAVNCCRGKFIAYCEGDDYWTVPDKLSSQISLFSDDATVGAVHSDFDRMIWSEKKATIHNAVRSQSGFVVPEGYVLDALYLDFFVTTCTVIVRTCLVREYLQSPLASEEFFGVDWPLIAVVSSQSQVRYLPRSTAVYRVADGSAMNRGYKNALARLRNVYADQAKIAAYLRISDSAVNEWKARYADALVAYAFRAQDRECLIEALELDGRKRRLRNRIFAICVRVPMLHQTLAKLIEFKDSIWTRYGLG